MASYLKQVGQMVHSTASILIDKQVTSRLSSTLNDLITTGFKGVEQVLKVVQDVTAPDPAVPSQLQQSQPKQGDQP